jgi:hypothetical protein
MLLGFPAEVRSKTTTLPNVKYSDDLFAADHLPPDSDLTW